MYALLRGSQSMRRSSSRQRRRLQSRRKFLLGYR
jgi:hypothetical protein